LSPGTSTILAICGVESGDGPKLKKPPANTGGFFVYINQKSDWNKFHRLFDLTL
jgi:hypothetical protein